MKEVKMFDCFFCGSKRSCKFVNDLGYMVLGEKKDGSEFGAHPMCDNCKSKANYRKEKR